MLRKFSCIEGCSDCCIYRQYYPSKEFGKIGVLILPEEKSEIEGLARRLGVNVKMIPRLGISRTNLQAPEEIIAYQMMGKNDDGDLCPFLDVEGMERSPHGGFNCRIYSERPLACRAYPLTDASGGKAALDEHCKFCRSFATNSASVQGMQGEIEALAKIKQKVRAGDDTKVWRYATAIGNEKDRPAMLPEGWIKVS